MRAVVDTNILVSGLLNAASVPGAVLADIATGRLEPVLCDAVMAEYRRVLPRPAFRIAPAAIDELIVMLDGIATWVPVPPYAGTPALPDPGDWPFIACALAAGCPVVTGNGRRLPATHGVQAMTARQCLGRGV